MVVGDIRARPDKPSKDMKDKECCISICAWFGPDGSCYDVSVTNSISAGCIYAAYVVPGHDCDDSDDQTKFRNNVAHSVTGDGAIVFPDVTGSGHSKCYEGSHFAAYKCSMSGILSHFWSEEIRWNHITLIDNSLGVINMPGVKGEEHNEAVLTNTMIYGESPAEDCPDGHSCYCYDKMGF